jgi:hypothetical protein
VLKGETFRVELIPKKWFTPKVSFLAKNLSTRSEPESGEQIIWNGSGAPEGFRLAYDITDRP